jgi:hypothetical protein
VVHSHIVIAIIVRLFQVPIEKQGGQFSISFIMVGVIVVFMGWHCFFTVGSLIRRLVLSGATLIMNTHVVIVDVKSDIEGTMMILY